MYGKFTWAGPAGRCNVRDGGIRHHAGSLLRIEPGADGVYRARSAAGRAGGGGGARGQREQLHGAQRQRRRAGRAAAGLLLRQGLLTPCAQRLGIRTGPGYALLDREGGASKTVFHVGPLLEADLWESTAVPELRVHAARLAEHLRGAAVPAESAAV